MSRKLYNAEYFERTTRRWIGFGSFVVVLVSLSLFFPGYNLFGVGSIGSGYDILNAGLIVLLSGGYIWWILNNQPEIVELQLEKEGFSLGDRMIAFHQLEGFFMEEDPKTQTFKHLALVYSVEKKKFELFTLLPEEGEHYKELVVVLQENNIPYITSFHQSFLTALARKLRI